MVATKLQIELLSDTTFSRGEGTAGVVDTEIEHDKYGIPFIGGKSVRGLLRDSWLSMKDHFNELAPAAISTLGRSEALDDSCQLRIGDATLPASIRATVYKACQRDKNPLSAQSILEAFTDIRYQTAEDRASGVPESTTLRSSRVVISGFCFEAPLTWMRGKPTKDELQVLALASLATRHAGLLRNRGRGHVRITIDGDLSATRRQAEKK